MLDDASFESDSILLTGFSALSLGAGEMSIRAELSSPSWVDDDAGSLEVDDDAEDVDVVVAATPVVVAVAAWDAPGGGIVMLDRERTGVSPTGDCDVMREMRLASSGSSSISS